LWYQLPKKNIFQIWIQRDWQIDFHHCGIFYPFALAISKEKVSLLKV